MGGGHARECRVLRLDKLKALLAGREYSTAAELAAELGISRRTLHRDLVLLRETGIPVEGDRGTWGGLRLEAGWSLGRVHLNEAEALGLLLGLTIAEKVGSPLLLDDLDSVTRRLAAAFAPAQARRIRALRSRILTGQAASARVLAGYTAPPSAVPGQPLDAFARCRTVLVRYEDRHGTVTGREIEPQFLYCSLPVWYVLAWDLLRGGIRAFRVDRVRVLRGAATEFRLRPAAAFRAAGEEAARTL
ncbi:helix-turn-helix transcriptional regulator [Streptomyces sp. HM190]|uniref:helix-turn-helix transcriptional regulator n=1 Tax=Streptomyces sp. HM190 TaxID=2695266 RepID=UPI001358D0D0|nr:HTH domain-containing protein [Streptomyces sp. HM190]